MIWYFGRWFLSLRRPLISNVSFYAKNVSPWSLTFCGGGRGKGVWESAPTRVNGLAFGTTLELLHGNGSNVLQMICAGIRDDAIPDDG